MTSQWEQLVGPEVYVERPSGEVRGAVVVCSEMYGVNDYVMTICGELAEQGYVAIAPDFYWRQVRRPQLVQTPEGREEGLAMMRKLDRDELLADSAAALDLAREYAAGRGVAFIGMSMGGHIALRAATALRFELAAVFYPGWTLNSGFPLAGPVPPIEQSADIAANGVYVLGFMGDLDAISPPEEWRAVGEHLTAAGVRHELVTYPGARHGFACQDRPADYDPDAGADAWRRVFQELERHL